jgi:hypothetical protein
MQNRNHGRTLELLRFAETHRRHTEALAKATGEYFNIFEILAIGHLEVKTHSPILAELLNPKGKHGQKATFLRLFLTRFLKSKALDFDADSATVMLEYAIQYGRIDILITDGNTAIIVENKIYAKDQENQLQRYYKGFSNSYLFYLTLEGDPPTNLSVSELKKINCESISYKQDILVWLEDCRKEAACLPNVRETISQYIHLIRKLTDQNTSNRMNAELIKEIVVNKESLAAFFTIYHSHGSVLTELTKQLDSQLNEVAKVTGLERRQEGPFELHSQDDGFYFTTHYLENCNLQIGFAFDKNWYGHFYYGFRKINHEQECFVKEQLQKEFMECFPDMKNEPSNQFWPAWAWWENPYWDWKEDAWEGVVSGEFVKNLKIRLEKMVEIAKKVCDGKINS